MMALGWTIAAMLYVIGVLGFYQAIRQFTAEEDIAVVRATALTWPLGIIRLLLRYYLAAGVEDDADLDGDE